MGFGESTLFLNRNHVSHEWTFSNFKVLDAEVLSLRNFSGYINKIDILNNATHGTVSLEFGSNTSIAEIGMQIKGFQVGNDSKIFS